MYRQSEKNLLNSNISPTCLAWQYGELRSTSGWDRFVSLGHPSKFQRLSRLGSVTARYSSCGMFRFPTGHYWHCSWPVKKASPGIMSMQIVDILNTFCEQTLANSLHFHVFLVQVASSHHVSFLLCWCLMFDRPTVLNCKALSLLKTVNE